jgi:hypothetical protein
MMATTIPQKKPMFWNLNQVPTTGVPVDCPATSHFAMALIRPLI